MISALEWRGIAKKWADEVVDESVRLFESGVAPSECNGLAIAIVESRRKRQAAAQAALAAPALPGPRRN